MKNLKLATLFFFVYLGSKGLIFAQDCQIFSGYSVGSVFNTIHYDERSRVTGTTKSLIVQFVPVQDGRLVILNSTYKDQKGSDFEMDIEVKCLNGDVEIAMEYFLDPEGLAEHTNKNLEIIGDKLVFPHDAKVGDRLGNGSVTLAIGTGSPVMVNLSTLIKGRTIVSVEELDLPAGRFECKRIEYTLLQQEGVVQTEYKLVEFYNSNLGVIRTERYNKKGKLVSWSQLEEIKG